MESDVTPDEILSRYILNKRVIKANNDIRHNLFMPYKEDNSTSVFRVVNLSETDIWNIGNVNVAEPQDKQLIARADIEVSNIEPIGDLIVKSAEPPERHAIITNWPNQREDQIELAKELALSAGKAILK